MPITETEEQKSCRIQRYWDAMKLPLAGNLEEIDLLIPERRQLWDSILPSCRTARRASEEEPVRYFLVLPLKFKADAPIPCSVN